MSIRVLQVALLSLVLAGTAIATEVYVNGVKVTGALRDLNLAKVDSVRFDERGDVHIAAPTYKIEFSNTAAKSPSIATGRYWMILNVATPGQFRVQVTVNQQQLMDIPLTRAQHVADLGAKLQTGENSINVTFAPTGQGDEGPPREAVDVLIGEGSKGADGTLHIRRVLATQKHESGRNTAVLYPLRLTVTD